MVTIPINGVRHLNELLIERLHLISVNNQKDSIITSYKEYANLQDNNVKMFQSRLIELDKVNKRLEKDIKSQRNKTNLLKAIAGSGLVIFVISIITK